MDQPPGSDRGNIGQSPLSLKTVRQEKTRENDWRVMSVIGAGRIKDEALKDLYRSHRLPPYATLAVHIRSVEELDDHEQEPMQGLAYCNGCPVGVTGWPFHVEGSIYSGYESAYGASA